MNIVVVVDTLGHFKPFAKFSVLSIIRLSFEKLLSICCVFIMMPLFSHPDVFVYNIAYTGFFIFLFLSLNGSAVNSAINVK